MAEDKSTRNFEDRRKMFDQNRESPNKPPMKRKPIGSIRGKKHSLLFERPHQLIQTDTEANKLSCVEETLELLGDLDKQVNTVAITGQYRTGKSYLLNRLAGCTTGFEVGNFVQACTKGIWIWCRDHPVQKDQILLLLDVEGFGDVYKANEREDFLLFTLATLLCSTMVYNNKGAFGAEALNRLRFLENIESNVCVVDKKNDIDMLDFYFPQFVLTLRDFDLHISTKAGKKTSPDGYFEDVLIQQRGSGEDIQKYNRTRLLIRNYFKERRCFAFKQPCLETNDMERKNDAELSTAFLKSLKEFMGFVYDCKPMSMKSGRAINGRMFASLAKTYVDQISDGETPCIRDAFVAMTKKENEAVIDHASQIYSDEMKRRLEIINPNDKGLVNHHHQCMQKALDYFKANIVFDDEQICHKQMQTRFKELFGKFKRVCDKNSEARCYDVLNRLNLKIVQKLKDNVYAKETGYDEYIDDINMLVKRYDGTCGLGTQSRHVLQTFLDEKAAEEEMVHKLVLKATGKDEEQFKHMGQFPEFASFNRQNDIFFVNETKLDKHDKQGSEGTASKATRRSVQRSDSHHETMIKEIQQLERQLSTEFQKKEDVTYEDIKQKYIDKLSLQLQEIDRQIQEGCIENMKALEDERSFLVKLIDASKEMNDLTEEFKEKLHAKPLITDRASMAHELSASYKSETIYAVPWEFQAIRLPPIGGENISEFKEKTPEMVDVPRRPRKPVKPFCTIQ